MKVGVQVSSFRPILNDEAQVRYAFERMRAMGCETVQLQWIDFSVAPEAIVSIMEENGITSVSTQDFYEVVREREEYFTRLNHLSGSEWVCVSGVPKEYLSREGLAQFAQELEAFSKKLRKEGLKLCFHPRRQEFEPVEGVEPVSFLMKEMQEELSICLDLYHVHRAGRSMAEMIRTYAGKVCMVHFKDYLENESGETLVPAGQGEIDWTEAIRACLETNVPYAFVEQERWERDAFTCIEEAFSWINGQIRAQT